MSELKRIVEEINNIIQEDELVDEFDNNEVTVNDVTLTPEASVSLTDELDAKANISRCLDMLRSAVDSFKTATVSEVDLIQDSNITSAIEGLDLAMINIEKALSNKTIDSQETLDLATTSDDSEEDMEFDDEVIDTEATVDEPEESNSDSEDNNEEDAEESNFEEEAELDLFSTN